MNIVFDNIIFSLQRTGGISVVWYEFISRYLKEYPAYARFIDYDARDNIFRKQLGIPADKIISSDRSFLKLKRYLPIHIKPEWSGPFIFHSSYYRICPDKNVVNITTVHDFTYEYYRTGVSKMLHTWQKNRAIRGADFIICISENTKNDLLKFLPDVDERKIRVIYNGVSEEYMPIIGNVLDKNLPFSVNSYVLFVGSRASYKNFYIAVEAIADSDYNFVIVGDPLTERESSILSSLFKGRNRYKCVGRVSNCFLNVLYNYAFALLYPSSYEGFGIPIIEAQKAGCPAIAYNASSIPEIIGNPRLLINTLSVNEIHNCLMILTNKEERQHIILEGIKNARRFSWDEMYKNIIDLYKEAWNMR